MEIFETLATAGPGLSDSYFQPEKLGKSIALEMVRALLAQSSTDPLSILTTLHRAMSLFEEAFMCADEGSFQETLWNAGYEYLDDLCQEFLKELSCPA